SAMGGGNVGDGIIVDLGDVNRDLLRIDPAARLARTGAAVSFSALNAEAAKQGLRLPPDPSSGRWATLGGMLSTNASGARSVRYGSVRPWVVAATLITADGRTLHLTRHDVAGAKPTPEHESPILARFAREMEPMIRRNAPLIAERFPKVRKNSAGYALNHYLQSGDLLDLVIGSEGTLGIVTEIVWRLDPIPPFHAALRLTLPSLDRLNELVPALLAFEPSGVELLDQSFLEIVKDSPAARALDLQGEAAAAILVEFEGTDQEEVDRRCGDAAEVARDWSDDITVALSEEEQEELRALRHAASPILAGQSGRRSLQVIEDACVPVPRLSDYVTAVRRLAAEKKLDVVIFGHAGDGNVHVNLLPDIRTIGWEQQVATLLDEVTAEVIALGGTPTGEHGDGRLRSGYLTQLYGAPIVALFQKVKETFDPTGILNPGIKLPAATPAPAISRLKLGASAVELPEDIAAALREIEITGGYAKDRMEIAGE
ncbi:MAG: FAD-binding oxidoreductase, partial [Gemmatimonadales bacterium]